MKLRFFLPGGHRLLALALALVSTSAGAAQLNFGGYNYDTSFGFTKGVLLGTNAVLGAAQLSSGLPSAASALVITQNGLATSDSIAQLTGVSSSFKALNLPNGNNGVTTRHGAGLTGGTITNGSGPDCVILEAGSTNVPEAFAVRVQTDASVFSDWYYFAAQATLDGSDGGVLFATPLDLSRMGFPETTVITNVQIINLKPTDRIAGSGSTIDGQLVGEGVVDFTGASAVKPYAGTQNTNGFSIYASDQFDPDPVYLAILLPPPALELQFNGANQVDIASPTYSTATYQLQGSTDLKSWSNIGSPVAGDGSVKTFSDTRTTETFFFWRLNVR
jgi:hypothetical protein